MIVSDRHGTDLDESPVGKDQTVPYGTDSRLNLFQAINCLATIGRSLRDGLFFDRIPGNELPGYLHSVPSGQS
jgi:hypothetical protein